MSFSPSIFKRLDAVLNQGEYSASDWKVYFHDFPISAICDAYVTILVGGGFST